MKVGGFLFACLVVVACGPSQDLGPAVTCSDITFANNGTDCGFEEPGVCSDTHAYAIQCEDDGTCTCAQDGHLVLSIIASDSPSGYCASLSDSSLHDLSAKCGWNLNQ